MQLIDKLNPLFMESIDNNSMGKTEKDTIKYFFENVKATKIPVVVEAEDGLLCSKIHQDNLVSSYEEFEEMDEEVIILARVSSGIVKRNKPFYV